MMNFTAKIRKKARKLVYKIITPDFKDCTILVYTMGKVGSSTIHSSLKRRLPETDIFHVHFLSEFWLKKRLPSLDIHFHQNIKIGNDILGYIREHSSRRLKVITLVREPIIRDISGIFENWKAHFGEAVAVSEDLLQAKMDSHSHEYTLTWFDTEFRNFLDFDIYAVPFDKERGFTIYKSSRADILCLRLEDLSRVYKEAFKAFLNLEGLDLIDRNKSADKDRKSLYRDVTKSYKVDKAKLEEVYSSRYVTHFYTAPEIAMFIKKWS
jgi:Putative capsular polysaccharide synthesis protein